MPASVAPWLVVGLLLTCAVLCWVQEGTTTLQIALLDLYTHVRPDTVLRHRRRQWVLFRRLWRVFRWLFIATAAAYAGVALRWG